jgi:Tol biopolymer transport system component
VAVLPGEPWLVYGWAVDPGGWYLALMRPDGSDAHRIVTDVPGEHKRASWSPDGLTLAFVVQDADTPNGSIWTARADGTGAALLSAGGTECPVGLFHPAWSPDGTKLAVVCYPGGDDTFSVAVLDLATKSLKRLATFSLPEFLDNAPTWSPDGTSIAFDILHWDPTGQFLDGSLVATVPAAGGDVQRLTSFDTFMAHPDWSPDGREIAINSNDLGNGSDDRASNVYVIRPDGTGLLQLTQSSVDGTMRIGCPRWDPDGSRVVVCIKTINAVDNSIFDVRLGFVDANGGEPVLISQTDGKYSDVRPTP